MNRRISVIRSLVVCCGIAFADDLSDTALARLLASNQTQQTAIARIVISGQSKVPLLLSWTRHPPSQVDGYQLKIGLADAFGRLKTRAAIPFLVKNISIERWPQNMNTWMKTPQVVEQRLPAVAALIQMGPDASRAVMDTPWERIDPSDRLAVIFVVSQVKGVAGARDFLNSALGEANMQRHWAEEGLKTLGTEGQ